MRATRLATILLGMALGCGSLVYGQTTPGNSGAGVGAGAGTVAPELSKLNVGTMLRQMKAATAEGNVDGPSPLQIVVQFLQLQPTQQTILGELLQARQTAVTPLFLGIAQREQQVEALLASGGNPAQVGVLVIQIHALQQQIMQVQQAFLTNLANLLDQEQQQRLAAVRVATQLQPVVPAFQILQLF
ncbi:MAG TPA: hypothetical protein VII25_12750 [Candidatus Acidoferrum sp.]|jgi:hypothetical protein